MKKKRDKYIYNPNKYEDPLYENKKHEERC